MEKRDYIPNVPKKEKRVETAVILIFTLVAIIVAAIIVKNNFSPALPDIDTDIPFATGPLYTETDEEGNKIVPSGGEEKYVRKEGVYNFLLVGYDKAAGLTDVIMLAHFDTNTGAINIIQIPRDTYARYNESGYYKKINGALSYYKRDLDKFASFLEANLCIQIDFYASVNLVAFRNIVDIIGGVEMYVPRDMEYDDPDQDLYINLKEGYQTLNGEQAEGFVRFRSGYAMADIGRTDAQKLFMTAFMKKFISSVNVSTLAQVGTQMLKYVETNLGLDDFIYFATKVLSIDIDKLTMMTLPGQSAREYDTRGTWYYVLSRSSMHEAVNKYLNVYTREIPASIFDQHKLFTNPDVEYMVEIYMSENDTNIYNGEDVDGSGIHIPAKKPSKPADTETSVTPEETDVPDADVDPDESEPADPETEEITDPEE